MFAGVILVCMPRISLLLSRVLLYFFPRSVSSPGAFGQMISLVRISTMSAKVVADSTGLNSPVSGAQKDEPDQRDVNPRPLRDGSKDKLGR